MIASPTLDELAVDVGWSILWARAAGYRVAPYYGPLLDSRDGVLCPLEAVAGKQLGEAALALALGLPENVVWEFTLGVDGGVDNFGHHVRPAAELGRRFRAELLGGSS